MWIYQATFLALENDKPIVAFKYDSNRMKKEAIVLVHYIKVELNEQILLATFQIFKKKKNKIFVWLGNQLYTKMIFYRVPVKKK